MRYLFLITLFLSSCSIKGSFQGLTSGWGRISRKDKFQYFKLIGSNESINIEQLQQEKILIITAKHLSDFIERNKLNVIVYMWNIGCRSPYCVSPSFFYEKCIEKNIQPLIVAAYYDTLMFRFNSLPLMAINYKYYKSNIVSVYEKRFLKELGLKKENRLFLCFVGGCFKGGFDNLLDALEFFSVK